MTYFAYISLETDDKILIFTNPAYCEISVSD